MAVLSNEERLNLLYRVATMYYHEGMTKAKIAGILSQSATHVANLLEEAKRKNIVTINVNVPTAQNLALGLKTRFPHLKEVVVVPFDRDCSDLLKQLGEAAAAYFEEMVTAGARIALGGGYLMFEMISQLPSRDRDIHIYPVAIMGRGPTIAHIDPVTLVTLLWAKSGRGKGRAHYVTVTPPDKETRESIVDHYEKLESTKKLRDLFSEIESVDFLFLSVGGLDADPEYVSIAQNGSQNLVLEMAGVTKEELKVEGAIGDIGYCFFDRDGKGRREWKIGNTLTLDKLRSLSETSDKRVVAVVGAYKMKSLEVIVNNRFCNVLITDSRAANSLLNQG